MTPEFGPITVKLDESLNLAFWRLVCIKSVKRMVIGGGIAIAAVLILPSLGTESYADLILPALVGLSVLGIMIAALWYWIWPSQAGKLFRETAALREQQSITIGTDGFAIEQASGKWRLNWTDMVKWDESDSVFAIFPNRATGYILPKMQVDDAAIDFARERLVEAGLTKQGKLRK